MQDLEYDLQLIPAPTNRQLSLRSRRSSAILFGPVPELPAPQTFLGPFGRYSCSRTFRVDTRSRCLLRSHIHLRPEALTRLPPEPRHADYSKRGFVRLSPAGTSRHSPRSRATKGGYRKQESIGRSRRA